MRAAVVPALGKPLGDPGRPRPEPGPGQVLVKIEASGLCHTDIHAARGDWPVKPKIPLIPGTRAWAVVVPVGTTWTRRQSETASRCPGSDTPAGSCRYCVAAGRPTARARSTWATRSTAATPSTRSATPATSSRSPTACRRWTPRP